MSQQILDVTDGEISIQFTFENPLELSPNDNFDISFDFSKFEKGLPPDLKIKRQAVRQIIPGAAANAVEAVGAAS